MIFPGELWPGHSLQHGTRRQDLCLHHRHRLHYGRLRTTCKNTDARGIATLRFGDESKKQRTQRSDPRRTEALRGCELPELHGQHDQGF
jgi:hypothetical protein